MAFPVTPPALTPQESINVISEAEAGISQCMADFLCNEIFPAIVLVTDVDDQVALSKTILGAYACKEKGIADVVNSLADKILADKGLLPGGEGNICSYDC